jgi:hypothetical protein
MKLKIEHASGIDPVESEWDCETVEDLLDKIRECGREVIITEDGEVIIYDAHVE